MFIKFETHVAKKPFDYLQEAVSEVILIKGQKPHYNL